MMPLLFLLESAFLLVGLLTVLYSLLLFIKRTGDYKAVLCFWQAKLTFNEKEYQLNRAGIGIMLGGILIRFINSWILS